MRPRAHAHCRRTAHSGLLPIRSTTDRLASAPADSPHSKSTGVRSISLTRAISALHGGSANALRPQRNID